MDWLRGPTVEQTVKDTKRTASRAQRELARDSTSLDREEKVLIAKIKDAAKRGNKGEQNILAKQVIQLRREKEKLMQMQGKLGAMKNQASAMKAQHTMSTVMASTGKTIKAMNASMKPEKMRENMYEFSMAQQKMEMNEEMMDDVLSGAFDEGEVETEADELVRKTLEEIGVDATSALGPAPKHSVRTAAQEEEDDAEADKLMKQLLGS